MTTKIETAKDLKWQYENNKVQVQKCLGNKKLENGTFITNPNNDKHNFSFSICQHHSEKPIFLNAYYVYYGDSSVSMFDNDFYIECIVEAINKNMCKIREDTEKIMEQNATKHYWKPNAKPKKSLKRLKNLVWISNKNVERIRCKDQEAQIMRE